jgi:hypothetical protein
MTRTGKKRSNWGLIVVISVFAVLTFIVIAAVVLLLITRPTSFDSSGNSLLTNTGPLTRLNTAQIDPALALAGLGGAPEAEVIVEAIDKERLETALAGLLFSPELADKESAGDFLFLADAYMANNQLKNAKFGFEMAGTIATLSPDIPDTVRAAIFMQAGEGLISLNEPELAKFYFDQAFAIASGSPNLQAAHRRPILQQLQKNYILLNERELARQSLDLSANPPDLDFLPETTALLPQGEAIPLPRSIQEAETNRWIKAQELAALLVERGGHASPAAITALEEALIEEDKQKLPFFEDELASTTQLSEKINITLAKIKWLSIKYRVAKQGYGLSIVPEWEADAEQIRADLTKTYEKLYPLYADYIVALPEVSQIDQATMEKLRREVLAGELGRYPNYPVEQRRKQLLDTSSHLMANQPELKIFIGTNNLAGQDRFMLQKAE